MLSTLLTVTTIAGLSLIYFFPGSTIINSVIVPYCLIFIAPVVGIHINYYIKSRNTTFIILENSLTIQRLNKSKIYYTTEIKNIIFFMSGTRLSNSSVGYFPFENYYYCVFTMYNNDQVIISSLFSEDIDTIISNRYQNVKIQKLSRFYPLIIGIRNFKLENSQEH